MNRTGRDGAEQLLAAVLWILPPERGEWGRAMRAELAALPGPERWAFAAGCLRAALRSAQPAWIARYVAAVAAAAVLTGMTGTTGAMRVEVIGLGLVLPVALGQLGRRDALVGRVAPTRAARVARRGWLAALSCCAVVGIETIVVTLPREGSAGSPTADVTGLTMLVVFLAGYLALGWAATSAVAALPGATLAASGGFGIAAGLAWCVLMPFDQTLAAPSGWRVITYGLALAVVVVAAPATAAAVAVRRSGDPMQGAIAGAGTGGLAALVMLAAGWALVRFAPMLVDSPLLDKGPAWRPPDLVEQVITSYLKILPVAPLLGALIGWLAAFVVAPRAELAPVRWRWIRPAAASALAVAGSLVFPGVNAAVAHDSTAFGGVGTAAVAFAPTGTTLLTGNGDNTWILWNVTDPGHPRRLATFNEDARYSPDGRTLASRNVLWNLADPARPARAAEYDGGVPVAFSAGGTLLATHRGRATTTFWRITGQTRPIRLGTVADGYSDGSFTPDGQTYVSRGDTTTTVWDIADPMRPVRVAVLPGTGREPVSPDGESLTTYTDAGIVLWNLADPARPRQIGVLAGTRDPDDGAAPAVYSPDSHSVAVGNRAGEVTLFDTTSAGRIAILAPAAGSNVQIGISDTLTTIAYAPGGHQLSVVTGNTTVTTWDITDPAHPARIRMLTRPTAGPGRVTFSPDTSTLAGAATNGTNSVTLWRLT